jgi:hypothetical protein
LSPATWPTSSDTALDKASREAEFYDSWLLEALTDVALIPAVKKCPAVATVFTRKANVAES